jgi:hypothetical protein
VRFGAEGVSGVPAGLGLWRTGGPAAGQLAAVGHRICGRHCPRAAAREEYAAYCVAGLSSAVGARSIMC